ncbi:CC_3452 family protein [Phenylobacterium sp.]|uniref:CC_3452 family protein n=1 Tax=Phenylobacterium sp. TaxID=1871053 RepID=UPI002FD8F1CA
MMIRTPVAALAALVALSLAGHAAAQMPAQTTVVAKLQQPTEWAQLVAGGAVFICEGVDCVANSPGSQTYAAPTCKALAKKFGPVVSFTRANRSFDESRLAACNASAAPVAGADD